MTEKKIVKITNIKEIKPRVIAFRSNRDIYAQIVDLNGAVLAEASSRGLEGTPVEQALATGEALAKKAIAAKIDSIVFDRNGFRYHGRIKALADGIRKGGIKF